MPAVVEDVAVEELLRVAADHIWSKNRFPSP
jgi:hypothetical protein